MSTVRFHDWGMSPLYARTTAMYGARRGASVTLALREQGPAHGERGILDREASARVDVHLASFADVAALASGAIARRYPAPDSREAEPSRLVLVEFTDPALPWLYSPMPAAGGAPRPWLVVLAGSEDAGDLALDSGLEIPEVTLAPAFLGRVPPLSESHKWAHVQSLDGESTARLLCPAVLEPMASYLVVVVPAFRIGSGGAPEAAWTPGQTDPVRLPAYATWRFRTGAADDFLALASALEPQAAPPEFGRVAVRYTRRPLERRLLAGGGLVAIGRPPADSRPTPADPWPAAQALPTSIGDDLRQLREHSLRDARGRPVLTLPDYGRPWNPRHESESEWSRDLNADPRLRGAAGLGVELGIKAQDELVDLTVQRLGPIREAEQRVRNLALGVGAARALWTRRLPADAAAQVFLLGPAMGRIVTQRGLLLEAVAGSDRPLSPALFTSAAKRVLRLGPARTALARPGLRPADAVRAANRCPLSPPDPAGLPTLRPGPIDSKRPLAPTALARMADPSTATDHKDASRLAALARAVDAVASASGGTGGTATSGTWRVPSPPVTLRVAYVEDPGPVSSFPREIAATVVVRLVGTTSGTDDRVEVSAMVQPNTAWPARWRLIVKVAGASTLLTAGATARTISLPGPQGNRTPRATLTLEALDRPGVANSAAVPVGLAQFALSIEATPVAWRPGEVDTDVTSRVTNLGDRSVPLSVALELGAAGADAGLPDAVGPFESAVASSRLTLATEPGDASARIRLRFQRQLTGTVTLVRGSTEPITLASSSWLVPYVLATASAAGGTPEAKHQWTAMQAWVEAVRADGLAAAPLDETPLSDVDPKDLALLVDRLESSSPPSSPERLCRPVSIEDLADTLLRAFDPMHKRARAIERVSSTISGRPDDAGVEPIGICPDVPTPVWELLRQHRGEWLLAGLGTVGANAVIGLKTNPPFVEALMVGINQQLIAELAWRGLPIGPGCSPLRRFWGRLHPESGEPLPDIAPIARWGDTGLGHATHAADEAGASLVVLLRTELFRRYPATLLYLLPTGDPAAPNFDHPENHHNLPRVYPAFQGRIGEDVTFFGFSTVTPLEALGHWVVLEEPAQGFRFWGRKARGGPVPEEVLADALASAAGGADLASRTLSDPIRIMIPGPQILPSSGGRKL